MANILPVVLFMLLLCVRISSLAYENYGITVQRLHVRSDIRYRFAKTLVTTTLLNGYSQPGQVEFKLELPERAFISNFTMLIDDRFIVGEVKEKQEAKLQFNEAKRRGESAGHIRAVPRHTNRFEIEVQVRSFGEVTFNLTYEELLQRSLGSYAHVINLNPQQTVDDFRVDVYINETRQLTEVKVPPITRDVSKKHLKLVTIATFQNDVTIVYNSDGYSAHVSYHPSKDTQLLEFDGRGVSGQFVVFYDVVRTADGGDIIVSDGYFIHYFAPDTFPVLDKNVMFVLDKSGSMSGRKISQVKNAMRAILSDLNQDDSFNVISFSNTTDFWSDALVKVTNDTINRGVEFVHKLKARGGTNINAAVRDAVQALTSVRNLDVLPIIIFLTDGDPTVGVTNTDTILHNIRSANADLKIPIFALGFGNDVDFQFLTRMSLENSGIARKIYEDSDADLQLEDFYSAISLPLLRNISITYLNGTVLESTIVKNKKINIFFGGDEFVVAGKLSAHKRCEISASVQGNGKNMVRNNLNTRIIKEEGCLRPLPISRPTNPIVEVKLGHIEKMWAYLTIKHLLQEMNETNDVNKKIKLRQRALNLSLKYEFVTPLTSIVVTLPENQSTSTDSTTTPSSFLLEQKLYSVTASIPPSSATNAGFVSPIDFTSLPAHHRGFTSTRPVPGLPAGNPANMRFFNYPDKRNSQPGAGNSQPGVKNSQPGEGNSQPGGGNSQHGGGNSFYLQFQRPFPTISGRPPLTFMIPPTYRPTFFMSLPAFPLTLSAQTPKSMPTTFMTGTNSVSPSLTRASTNGGTSQTNKETSFTTTTTPAVSAFAASPACASYNNLNSTVDLLSGAVDISGVDILGSVDNFGELIKIYVSLPMEHIQVDVDKYQIDIVAPASGRTSLPWSVNIKHNVTTFQLSVATTSYPEILELTLQLGTPMPPDTTDVRIFRHFNGQHVCFDIFNIGLAV